MRFEYSAFDTMVIHSVRAHLTFRRAYDITRIQSSKTVHYTTKDQKKHKENLYGTDHFSAFAQGSY